MWNLVNCSMICENLYPQHPEPGKKEKFKMKSQFDVILHCSLWSIFVVNFIFDSRVIASVVHKQKRM